MATNLNTPVPDQTRQPFVDEQRIINPAWFRWLLQLWSQANVVVANTVTHTGNLLLNHLVVGNGAADIKTVSATDGQVPIGSSGDGSVTLATLTAGTGVTITNASHSVTIASSAGTVTHTGALTSGQLVYGNGTADIHVVAATDGQIPIGKTSDGTSALSTLTAGTGITVTNGAGAVTIAVANPVFKATLTMNDSQIKALPTTAITLVAAPGSGFAICPLHATLYSKTTSGAYTNINASGVLGCRFPTFKQGLSYVPNDPAITNGSATLLSDLLGTTTNQRCSLIPTQSTEGVDDWGPVPFIEPTAAGFDNQPLQFDVDNNGAGNFTGGNAANTLTAIVYYTIETIP